MGEQAVQMVFMEAAQGFAELITFGMTRFEISRLDRYKIWPDRLFPLVESCSSLLPSSPALVYR